MMFAPVTVPIEVVPFKWTTQFTSADENDASALRFRCPAAATHVRLEAQLTLQNATCELDCLTQVLPLSLV